MEDYYHSACGVKSSFLKTLLIREYGDSIGFYTRHQKNESEVFYDWRNSSSYVEAAISSIEITDETLIKDWRRKILFLGFLSQLEEPDVLNALLIAESWAVLERQR